MFDSLTRSFDAIRQRLAGKKTLSDDNISEALREVRVALLEADVNFKVCKAFVARIKERVTGEEVIRGVNPGDQFVKSIHDGLVELMGPEDPNIRWRAEGPTVILMAGLQGSGKTTTCGKLAKRFIKDGKKVLLVAADIQRPAAIEQLKVLGGQVGADVHAVPGGHPPTLCREAVARAKDEGHEVVILDTAGRLHIDAELMREVSEVAAGTNPDEIFLVLDANTGQDAVNSAAEFDATLALTGVIMTKLDSGTRGGAALSVKEVTGKPIKFIGIGEKLDDLDAFHPNRMADRILGMGDVVSLVERAQEAIDEEEAEKTAKQLFTGAFNFEDFLKTLQMVKSMGPIKDLLKLVPGMGSQMAAIDSLDEREFARSEAMIQSMTPMERVHPEILNMSRRERIARGAGVGVDQVHNLVRGFKQMRGQMKELKKAGMFGRMMGDPTKAFAKEKAKEVKKLESEGKSVLDLPAFRGIRSPKASGTKTKKRKNRR
ncbi:MAG: signal recognition particle protein [Planctomycetota bacterium]